MGEIDTTRARVSDGTNLHQSNFLLSLDTMQNRHVTDAGPERPFGCLDVLMLPSEQAVILFPTFS